MNASQSQSLLPYDQDNASDEQRMFSLSTVLDDSAGTAFSYDGSNQMFTTSRAYAEPSNSILRATARPFIPQTPVPNAQPSQSDISLPIVREQSETHYAVYRVCQPLQQSYYPTPFVAFGNDELSVGVLEILGLAMSTTLPPNQSPNFHFSENTSLPVQQSLNGISQSNVQQVSLAQNSGCPAPPSLLQIHQAFEQQPSTVPTERMLQEASTAGDPTRFMTREMQSLLPRPIQQPVPADRTGSQISSQHTCHHKGCYKTFEIKSKLTKHEQKHLNPEDRPMRCEFCSKTFIYQKDLTRHFGSQAHRKRASSLQHKVRILCCPISSCKYHHRGFPRRDNFVRHMQKHPGHENEKPIICETDNSSNSLMTS